jgi:hypothetical protein
MASSDAARPVGLGIRAFLIVAAPLAFLGGCQLTLLAEHTDEFWACTIALPSGSSARCSPGRSTAT